MDLPDRAYALFGGADFGGGFWDLIAGRAGQGRAQRNLIKHSIGPIWEANHVWLIFVIILTWTVVPSVFAAVSSTLYVPLTLVAVGIIARGSAFAFRKVSERLWQQRIFGARRQSPPRPKILAGEPPGRHHRSRGNTPRSSTEFQPTAAAALYAVYAWRFSTQEFDLGRARDVPSALAASASGQASSIVWSLAAVTLGCVASSIVARRRPPGYAPGDIFCRCALALAEASRAGVRSAAGSGSGWLAPAVRDERSVRSQANGRGVAFSSSEKT
ncbi:cytochrome d ubiquinol oxidase subunit II [Arthrobacter sp.]|uniref:cytochrome d ubiquinol oxidase subunit II n=1 Tax=Arthrobacter sp. TaxID=1667 RepID=UPI003399B002